MLITLALVGLVLLIWELLVGLVLVIWELAKDVMEEDKEND